MQLSPIQLLEHNFQPVIQANHGPEGGRLLRFVVKLHRATRLHYDLRFELYGRLLSFTINDLKDCWKTSAAITRVSDHNAKNIYIERCIPPDCYGAGPILVWDHGIYRSNLGTEEDIYRQLLQGSLEISLQGIRLHGRFRIDGRGKNWRIQRLSGTPSPDSHQSVLTGRTLTEIETGLTSKKSANRLWLEWEGFHATQTAEPEIVIHEKKVVDHNFAAKTHGISNGMLLQHVLPLVPNCRVTPFAPNSERQKAWLDLLLPYSNTIQPCDCRSAALDLTGHPDPADIAGKIITKLTKEHFGFLNYGTGPSLWIAQLATQLKDPFGFTFNQAQRLAPLTVEHLLAIPEQDRERLQRLGFQTIGEIAVTSPEQLHLQFGESAYRIIAAAQGKTRDQITPLYPPRATVETMSFDSPVNDSLSFEKATDTLAHRLAEKIKGQQAGLAILTAECEDGTEHTLQRPYNRPLHTPDRIQASLAYLATELQKTCPNIVRLTARLNRLEPHKTSQQDLFIAASRTDSQAAIDSLKCALGNKSIVLASEIEAPRREQVLKAWRNATGWN